MYTPTVPKQLGLTFFRDISLETVIPYIDWRFFFSAWKLIGSYPNIENVCLCEACTMKWLSQFEEKNRKKAKEALSLFNDAQYILRKIRDEKEFSINAFVGLFPAKSKNEGICFTHQGKELFLPTLRQQEKKATANDYYYSLCDFIAPTNDFCGTFGVSVSGAETVAKTLEKTGNNYEALLYKSVADRIAEATTEWLHQEVRTKIWGYAPDENLSVAEILKGKYKGIRPAIGYPSLPDQSVIFLLKDILPLTEIGVSLTKNGAMFPNASMCGLIIAHPKSKYFIIQRITEEQLVSYAEKCAKTVDEIKPFLLKLL